MPLLLLKAGMAVIPIGARLPDRELVGEGLPRPNARKADPGHAVHVEGQQQPVPVDRGVFAEHVGDVETDLLPFPEADQRPRHRAVDRDTVALAPLHHARPLAHREIDDRTGKLVEADADRRPAPPVMQRVPLRPGRHRRESGCGACGAHETAAGKSGDGHDVLYAPFGRLVATHVGLGRNAECPEDRAGTFPALRAVLH